MFEKLICINKENKEHMKIVPQISENIKDNFEELIKLSKRRGSSFKLSGEYKNFIIKEKSKFIIEIICWAIAIPIVLLKISQESTPIITTLIIAGIIILILLYYRFYPTTNNIEVDIYSKILSIKSNNYIARILKPSYQIDFKDIEGFTFKEIRRKTNSGKSSKYNLVYIHSNNKKIKLINLPCSNFAYVNPNIFIGNLSSIINKSKTK